ncbi:heat shock 70 kDa protein 14-like [Dorcoceras hygrometricum]|uniref:Heat shock 70 kDa protein 14-like n=1 Tax=Dorcoceras hygrometricum TaxID=472368 RepID=A0A2Z7B9U1_9LAMI|nr:heat shock 70 kDa protein 14-like [Dorcoceras hygrometricum]
MSAVGFDFGNDNCVVAVARQTDIEIVLNDESECETPSIVSFGVRQRYIGTAGAAASLSNPTNTISQIKRLLGRRFSDPELQHDLKSLPFLVTKGPDGYPLIQVQYMGETTTFTPTQVLGMLLFNLKSIAEKSLNAPIADCCIGIPVYFTDPQRRAVIDAATIAGLSPLRLLHETTATALLYGIHKADLTETEQLNIVFVDIGHTSMQVCVAAFKKGELKILAHSFDRCLGGRDFDEVLFQHFAARFKDKYKIDVFGSAMACLRLRAACETLKKVLSANPEAPLNIEGLMDGKDVKGFIKREEFEKIIIPILDRLKQPLKKALDEAGLTIEDIHSVEFVGSGARVPAIIKILTDFFGKEPHCTINASECVAKGCAMQCAILSPRFMVREFQVNESFPFNIAMSWNINVSDTENGVMDDQNSTIVYPIGNPIPSVKAMTFYRYGRLTLDVLYADVMKLSGPAKISTYMIGPIPSTNGERVKLKVKVRLNIHGIVSVETAKVVDQDETGKTRKTSVHITEVLYGGLAAIDLQKAVEKEFAMALQDRAMEETKGRNNDVESNVYETQDKPAMTPTPTDKALDTDDIVQPRQDSSPQASRPTTQRLLPRAIFSITEDSDTEEPDLSFMDVPISCKNPLEQTFPCEADVASAKSMLRLFLDLRLLDLGESQRAAMLSALSVLQSSPGFSQSPAGRVLETLPAVLSDSQAATASCLELSAKLYKFRSERSRRDDLLAKKTALSSEVSQLSKDYHAEEEQVKKLKDEIVRRKEKMTSMLKRGESMQATIAQVGGEARCLGEQLASQKGSYQTWIASLQVAEHAQSACYTRWEELRRVSL